MFSVRILVGTEGEKGTLTQAAENATASPAQAATQSGNGFASSGRSSDNDGNEKVAMGFTPDEDLIDNTQGFEPSGMSTEPVLAGPADVDGTQTGGN
ncbi:MAG: hypothetical protein KDE55_11405 [Novosphingobium sp.]|nr:hypothetical protein [Novosphingobium sp.]